jgi:hypothetical protein
MRRARGGATPRAPQRTATRYRRELSRVKCTLPPVRIATLEPVSTLERGHAMHSTRKRWKLMWPYLARKA